jgi:hypothetical protein
MPHNRIVEMSKCETHFGSAYGQNHWSHWWKMEEGASATKLNFRRFGDHYMKRKETLIIGIMKCRNVKW